MQLPHSTRPPSKEDYTAITRFPFKRSVWAATAGPAPESQPVEPDADCDAIVIGGGIAGSTARTIEKALFARRLLLSGRQVPEVYATDVAREHADTSIAELDREIDNLLFETRVRREVVSRTVVTLLQRAAARRQASLNIPSVPTIDPRPLKNGRVPQ